MINQRQNQFKKKLSLLDLLIIFLLSSVICILTVYVFFWNDFSYLRSASKLIPIIDFFLTLPVSMIGFLIGSFGLAKDGGEDLGFLLLYTMPLLGFIFWFCIFFILARLTQRFLKHDNFAIKHILSITIVLFLVIPYLYFSRSINEMDMCLSGNLNSKIMDLPSEIDFCFKRITAKDLGAYLNEPQYIINYCNSLSDEKLVKTTDGSSSVSFRGYCKNNLRAKSIKIKFNTVKIGELVQISVKGLSHEYYNYVKLTKAIPSGGYYDKGSLWIGKIPENNEISFILKDKICQSSVDPCHDDLIDLLPGDYTLSFSSPGDDIIIESDFRVLKLGEKLNESPTQTPSAQSANFQDDELGIFFQIPESWGKAIVKNDFSSTQILREISFSSQPNVKLVSFTEHRLYPAQFDEQGISSNADIRSFCESQLKYLSGGDEPKTINGQDLFRQNGAYNFGNCAAAPPLLNISKKTSTEGVGWIPMNNPKTSTSKIELSRSYFWSLQNQIYHSLTLKVDVPDTTSNDFCIIQFFYGGNDYRLSKSSGCINHKEKGLIEAAFRDFDSTQLSKEINSLVSSVQTYSADKAASIYDNYFKDKAAFRDAGLGISFSYPSVFGQPKYDVNTRVLKFLNDKNDVLRIEVNTLADIAQAEKEAAKCEGPCLGPLTSQERWKKEKDILAQGALGQIQCSFGGDYCEVANIGNTKMLVRYFKQWPRTDGIRKEYTFYVGDKRFDSLTNSYGVYTHDLKEYRRGETTDFTLKLVSEILESIKIER